MSRRREVPKRSILPDPKFGSERLAKFVNMIMVDGKKSVAENVVYGALDVIGTKSKGEEPIDTLEKAAEDTRHSRKLLDHYAIHTPMTPLHDHNESQKSSWIIQQLQAGASVALISDAGTPLISDPGYKLVNEVITAGFPVEPVPGVSALTTALSAAGLPTDQFLFTGFLPAKAMARRQALQVLLQQVATIVCYESSHRIRQLLEDLVALAPQRAVVVAKELTKLHEQFFRGSADEVSLRFQADEQLHKGEFVVLIAGAADNSGYSQQQLDDYLRLLAKEQVSHKTAAALLAQITGEKKNTLYKRLLYLMQNDE